MAVSKQREKAAEKNKKDGREVAHAEPENRKRNPSQRRDGAKDLNQGIECHVCPAVPADDEPQRHSQHNRQSEAPGHAE